MTLLAAMSAITVVMYNFLAIRAVPGFPFFLSLDISDAPVLLTGFMLGPLAGAIVVLIRFLLKLPMTSTMGVGETADLILGLTFVLTASLVYKKTRTKQGAMIGLGIGIITTTAVAVIVNRFILVPFFVWYIFGGSWDALLNALGPIYPGITRDNFFVYYLLLATIPFNLIRLLICGLIVFALYKRLQKIIKKIERKNDAIIETIDEDEQMPAETIRDDKSIAE